MPGKKEESVHLASMPSPKAEWLNAGLEEKWTRLAVYKTEISKALEVARQSARIIGHPLDAEVVVIPAGI